MYNQDNLLISSTLQSEDKKRNTQLQTIFVYLQKNVATASMVTAATGIAQKCITRYKRDLELTGQLWELKKDVCKVTGFKAWYLTTDLSKAPSRSPQIDLFKSDDSSSVQQSEGLNRW